MDSYRSAIYAGLILLVVACSSSNVEEGPQDDIPPQDQQYPLDRIQLPDGFAISIYAEVNNARSMSLSDDGTLFVSNRAEDKVYAVRDSDGDNRADQKWIIDQGLNTPNGVAFDGTDLYVAEISRILKYENILQNLDSPPDPVVVFDDLPTDRHHGWKYIAFGPDGKLYIPIGAPCNICDEGDPYSSINRINKDGTGFETYARGVRNTVGFTWHPKTGELWFTDNGRDWMGDNSPPCELNYAPEAGMHFGYPYCHGGTIKDPEFGDTAPCSDFTEPAQNLGPHVAPLGMEFYYGDQFPAEYQDQIFIAEHGSWNRSTKIGYRVTLVRLQGNTAVSYETFASGWLNDDTQGIWGRPVDVVVARDGSLLVSDDYAGLIYRIYYEG